MYFENLSEIPALASAYSSTIFNLEKNPNIRATYLIEPDEKDNNKIPVEAIREILTHLNSIHTSDIFVVINHAETLTPRGAQEPLPSRTFYQKSEPFTRHHPFAFRDFLPQREGLFKNRARSRSQNLRPCQKTTCSKR